SHTVAAAAACAGSCTSVNTGSPLSRRTVSSCRSPRSRPGPRGASGRLRFALSKDALYRTVSPRSVARPASVSAIPTLSASSSSTQGPAIRKNGPSGRNSGAARPDPISVPDLDRLPCTGLVARKREAAPLHGGADERREQRVRPHRPRLQLRMELAADEPRVV